MLDRILSAQDPIHFVRSHGLGNDYLVADAASLPLDITPARARLLCDRHLGLGSDGILLLLVGGQPDRPWSLRIVNPDGSEAEKSGNGVRIFAKWLFDTGRSHGRTRFSIETPGGVVPVELDVVDGRARVVTAGMGRASIRRDLRELEVGGLRLPVVAVSIGNPHCVVLRPSLDITELRRLGPLIEHHAAFPGRTNVQLAHPLDRAYVEALIWERGAGETRASGSSACAVVAACHALGLVDRQVTVRMPGGELAIRIDEDGQIVMRGPVEEVASIRLSPELIERLRTLP